MGTHDGGPAFPQVATSEAWAGTGGDGYQVYGDVSAPGGMTLRDYFAAKAMQGIRVAMPAGHADEYTTVARMAYAQADSMLAARTEQPE